MSDQIKSSSNIQLGFMTGAFPEDPTGIHLLGVSGTEALSQLFSYDLLLSRPAGPLTDDELESIVRYPCAIALGPSVAEVVHGLLIEIEHLDATRYVAPRYVARMVPQLHLLTMGRRSSIYQQQTVLEMAELILTSHGLTKGTHFEIKIAKPERSPKREYMVQYQESDWAFISRWLEHEGYFYWFRHDKRGATLVIADSNDDASLIAAPTEVAYRERNNLATDGLSTVFDFRVHQQRVPAKVTVVDYNYRQPAERLIVTEPVADSGFGNVFTYDNHFKTKLEGKELALARAERFRAVQRTVSGATDCSRFRVGHKFELENHHHSAYDGSYLLTKLDLKVGYEVHNARAASTEAVSETQHVFTCRFEGLPSAVEYRPERTTPWPTVPSFITGHIEADTAGDHAQIDKQGRYKVRLNFDTGTTRGLPASRWIRMAQPYSGAGYGSHFPLHKGTEVAIAHADGDPDRPLIIGATPNPHTLTPVTSSNATQSVIQTASGIRVELEDFQN